MIRGFITGLALVALTVVSIRYVDSRAPNEAAYGLDWEIKLDQPIRQLEEFMGETTQQQHYNFTSANMAFVYDAKLYILFHDLLRSAGPAERAELLDSQRLFLREREIRVDAVYDTYNGGTGGSLAGNLEFIDLTRQRIEELGGGPKERTEPDQVPDALPAGSQSVASMS